MRIALYLGRSWEFVLDALQLSNSIKLFVREVSRDPAQIGASFLATGPCAAWIQDVQQLDGAGWCANGAMSAVCVYEI